MYLYNGISRYLYRPLDIKKIRIPMYIFRSVRNVIIMFINGFHEKGNEE